MTDPNKSILYKLLKPFVILKFRLKYHPVVIGRENIPKSGRIIICGNHRHKDDQYNVMMVTERIIHYMAKDEYFKGRMAWLYRAGGAIPVDRTIHDEKAKSEARNVLENDGVLGLFPEGTRNEVTCKEDKLNELYSIVKEDMSKEELINVIIDRSIRYTQIDILKKLEEEKAITRKELKEYVLDADNSLKKLLNEKKISEREYKESLLLPFKFGAVSLADKTDSMIVPFATIGYYNGKRNQLVTKIGKPFKVKGMDLGDANRLLREKILELM